MGIEAEFRIRLHLISLLTGWNTRLPDLHNSWKSRFNPAFRMADQGQESSVSPGTVIPNNLPCINHSVHSIPARNRRCRHMPGLLQEVDKMGNRNSKFSGLGVPGNLMVMPLDDMRKGSGSKIKILPE